MGDLPADVRKTVNDNHFPSDYKENLTLEDIKRRAEREVLSRTLKQVKGNKFKAAKLLNISRSTLYAKIEKHKIEC